jgi:hypothetical protein
MLVESTDIIYEDGQELTRVTGYIDGEEKSITEYYPGVIPADLKRGTVIRISHHDNKATKIVTLLSPEEIKNKTTKVILGSGYSAEEARFFAPIYSLSTVGVTLLTPTEWKTSIGETFTAAFKYNTKLVTTVYDTKTDEMYVGDMHDLYQKYMPNSDGTLPAEDDLIMVCMRTRYSAILEAIVILY